MIIVMTSQKKERNLIRNPLHKINHAENKQYTLNMVEISYMKFRKNKKHLQKKKTFSIFQKRTEKDVMFILCKINLKKG